MSMFNNWAGGGNKVAATQQGQQPQQGSGNQQNNQNNQTNNQNNNANNQGGGGQANQQNNSGANDDPLDTIWKEMADDGKGGQSQQNAQNNQNNQQNNQNNQQDDPDKQVADYLTKQGLGEFKLSDAEKEQLKNGEGLDQVLSNLNNRIQTAFIKSISSANQLMDAKIEKAVEKAVQSSKNFFSGQQVKELLYARIPQTKDPAIAPVAETVMRQFLTKGATTEQALEGTKKWFDRVGKAFGLVPNTNTRQGYGGSSGRNSFNGSDNTNDDEGETNWLDLLKGN